MVTTKVVLFVWCSGQPSINSATLTRMTGTDLLEKLLVLRGITTVEDRKAFLHPQYDKLYDPMFMHDMEKSVTRIFSAIQNNEKICIYSDYDADGIPGGVIMHDFFKKIGYEHFTNYIPHRHDEGYGLHVAALQQLANDGVRLVITVDVGITAVDEVAQGNEFGLDIIITDHHEPLETLPPAYAIVNPKLGNYPDPMLCGAGVVFKLVQALLLCGRGYVATDSADVLACRTRSDAEIQKMQNADARTGFGFTHSALPVATIASIEQIPEGWEKWLLDMAGMATLSDMVPLQNENRIIAYFGMKVLQKTQRPGLKALFEKSGINLDYLIEEDITFSITPKLNAAGRMAHPMDAFRALATTDRRDAIIAAEHLSGLNDERKKIVARIMRDVHKRVAMRKTDGGLKNILVMGDPSWPAGILGLIASKIIEEYSVTTFVWGAEGDVIKGSARGIGDVPIVQLMQSCSQLLVQFGGHDDAGGFSATREHIHFLEAAFCEQYEKYKKQKPVEDQEKNNYDLELELSDVTMHNYHALRQMAPFGVGNPKPVFAFKNVVVDSVRQFGKTTEHLEVILVNKQTKIKAISWFATADSFTEKIEAGKSITLLGEFDFSVFRGKSELRLKIVDVIQ